MHIAFLTPEYPHAKISNSAGIGTSIKNMATQLIIQNVQVSVFIYSQDKTEILNDKGITIYKIKHRKYKVFGWYFYRKHVQNFINTIIKEEKVDLIEAPDWTGITAFMKFHCPLIIRLHGTDAYFCKLEGRKQKKKNYFFEKKALKNAQSIVSVSKFTAEKTSKIFNIKKPIEVIYNGIDTTLFSSINKSVEANSILYFGSLIRKKGVLELSHIFNEVVEKKPEASMILLGKDVIDIQTGKSTLSLINDLLSNNAKQRVKHIKQVPYHQVKEYIAKANVVVLPSFAEAFPMTWLEAMAMKKSLVTSNIGWASELMINGKTGFTEHPINHREYANKILALLEDEKLCKQIGEEARNRIVQNFDSLKITKQNIEFYKNIIA